MAALAAGATRRDWDTHGDFHRKQPAMIWWLCPACEQTFEQDPGPQHYADPGDPCGVRPIRVAPVTPFRFGVVLTDSSGRRVAELGAEALAEPGMLLAFQRVRLRGENFTVTVSATQPDA